MFKFFSNGGAASILVVAHAVAYGADTPPPIPNPATVPPAAAMNSASPMLFRSTARPQEPAGFIAGAVIGGFAAGPVGAVVGAGLGTWLGNRVRRAGDARIAERELAALKMRTASPAPLALAAVLQGLQGGVLFRTGSFELTPEMSAQVRALAKALGSASVSRVVVEGYADPRGTSADNLRLSAARALAVRDLLVVGGVRDAALEVVAHGQDESVAEYGDTDGYALERRVRITVMPVEARGAVALVEKH